MQIQKGVLDWEFGKVDVIWQEDRYSPVYDPDCGIKNKIYIMNQG